jgi:hypothetical protein
MINHNHPAQSLSSSQIFNEHILSSLPLPHSHIPIRQRQSPLTVHLPKLESALIDPSIVPGEPPPRVMHLPVLELALVPTVFCGQFALGFLPALEPALELALGSREEKLPLAMHLAILELPIIDLPIAPVEEPSALLDAIHPISRIDSLIRVRLLALTVGSVLLPMPLIGRLVDRRDEPPLALELVVDEGTAIVRSIGEDEQPVGALRSPVDEFSDEVDTRFGQGLALAVLLTALPATSVEDIGCGHHIVKREDLCRFSGFREFFIRREVLMVFNCLSRVCSTIFSREGACSANLAYWGEGLFLLRWVGRGGT